MAAAAAVEVVLVVVVVVATHGLIKSVYVIKKRNSGSGVYLGVTVDVTPASRM